MHKFLGLETTAISTTRDATTPNPIDVATKDHQSKNETDTESPMRCYTGTKTNALGLQEDSYSWTDCHPESACLNVKASVVLAASTIGKLVHD